MKMHVLKSSVIATLLLTGAQMMLSAQETADSRKEKLGIEGVWITSVSIRDCQSGTVIRTVRALNLFIHDGSSVETAVNVLRTPSVGSWKRLEGQTYASTFTFYRYNPDGTFASKAKVTRTIELSEEGNDFTTTGTVEDFDANNVLISKSCPTETGTRAE